MVGDRFGSIIRGKPVAMFTPDALNCLSTLRMWLVY